MIPDNKWGIARWVEMNGIHLAVTKDNVLVGHVVPVHMLPRRSRRRVEVVEQAGW